MLRRRRRRRVQLPGHHRQRLAAPGVRPGHAGGRDRGRELSRVPHRRRDRAADRAGSRACAGGGARRRAGGAGARGAHGAGGARARGVDVVVGRERQGDRRALRDARARRRVILALAVAALALAIRVLVAEFLPVIQPDGVVYVAVAKQFQATGSPFDPLFHPLYPILISLAQPFVGDWEMSGRLVSAFFGALVILPAFALARGIVGRQAALLSGVFIAVHPRLVQNSASVLCEATYTFLLVSGVLAARRGLGAGPRALIAFAGVCFGLAYLVRPEGALYLVGLIAIASFRVVSGRERAAALDRKSTRLNSSHANISYAVFCLKKKKPDHQIRAAQPADARPHAARPASALCGRALHHRPDHLPALVLPRARPCSRAALAADRGLWDGEAGCVARQEAEVWGVGGVDRGVGGAGGGRDEVRPPGPVCRPALRQPEPVPR